MGVWAKNRAPALGAALVVCMLAAGPLGAQTRIEAARPGTQVQIKGAVNLGGVAPIPLGDLPPGHYLLRAGGPGLATGVGRLVRDGAGELSVSAAGGAGSLLYPPGFAHFRLKESTRGFLYLAAGAAGLTGVALQQFDLDDAEKSADRAQGRYNDAVSAEEFDRARLDLLAANDLRADEKDLRALWGTYLGAAWIGAAVETWFLSPTPTLRKQADGNYVLDVPTAGGAGAAVKSLLVPGAGQRALGHEGRGNRFSAGVMILAASSIIAQDVFLDARREQNDAQRRYEIAETESEVERWRGELEDAADRTNDRNRLRWAFVGATVGVYLWNIFDAGTLGGEALPPGPVSWQLVPESDGFRAGLTWRIS